MRTRTPYLDRASVRPHDPLKRAALALGVGLEILVALKLLGPGFGVAVLLLVVAVLALLAWQPLATLLVAGAISAAIVYRRARRLREAELARRDRERETDREIPF